MSVLNNLDQIWNCNILWSEYIFLTLRSDLTYYFYLSQCVRIVGEQSLNMTRQRGMASVFNVEQLSKKTQSWMRLLSERHRTELPSFKVLLSDREQVCSSLFYAILWFDWLKSSLAHARISGPYGNRGNNESREQTIANGSSIATMIILKYLIDLHHSRQKDSEYCKYSAIIGSGLSCSHTHVYARSRTQIHQRS